MTPTYRVSHLAAYARWKQQDGDDISWLWKSIFSDESSESQSRGTAFHAAMEKIQSGEYSTIEANGYTFTFTCEAEVYMPKLREIRKGKDYGGIIVSGQCDGIEGRRIRDDKTVQQFDAEYHLDGWQHRFYLDIFEADRFDWHIWEVGEIDARSSEEFKQREGVPSKAYEVYAHHLLTQYRYPALEEDCRALALEFRDFAARMSWSSRAA